MSWKIKILATSFLFLMALFTLRVKVFLRVKWYTTNIQQRTVLRILKELCYLDPLFLLYNKCFNRVVMKYEKEKQKLITLVWLELLGESNFHFWGKFMTEVLETKQFLKESVEQHGSGWPHLPLSMLLFSAICLSSSCREITALRYIYTLYIHFLGHSGHTASALWICVLVCLDIHLPILTVLASRE